MSKRIEEALIGIARTWVRCYTAGLPEDIRKARRDEIRSDLWEHTHHLRVEGGPPGEIMGRMARGVPEDIMWRLQQCKGGDGFMFMLRGKAYLRALAVLAMLFFLFPLGVASFILALIAVVIPGAMIAAPFYYRTETIRMGSWVVDTLGEAVLISLIGLALFFLAVLVIELVARLIGRHISLRIGRLRLGY